MKRSSVFTAQPSIAEQTLCRCNGEGQSPRCQEVIGIVEELTVLVSQPHYDPSEASALIKKLNALGVSEEKIHTFFAARFVVGIGVNPEMEIQPEKIVLKRVGFNDERIQKLVASGKEVASFCKESGMAADHIIATFVTEGRAPQSLVLNL